MRLLTLAVIGATGLFVGSANAAVSSNVNSEKEMWATVCVIDELVIAKQGRGGHDDPPGDDHGGLVVVG